MCVVYFDGTGKLFPNERRQVNFLWWGQDSNPGICETLSPADWMPGHKPIEDWAIKTHQIACTYDDWAFSPLDTCIHMYVYGHTYVFAVVNFDALAHASDFQIERRRVVFLCWMQDSNNGSLRHQIASKPNFHSKTDWAIIYTLHTYTLNVIILIDRVTNIKHMSSRACNKRKHPLISNNDQCMVKDFSFPGIII